MQRCRAGTIRQATVSGAQGFIPDPIKDNLPDLPTNAGFQYGVYEGVPRILDMLDKHDVKMSSFMIGDAVRKAPDLAQEIVRRGHEAAAHGRTWENSYFLNKDDEKRFIADGMSGHDLLHRIALSRITSNAG